MRLPANLLKQSPRSRHRWYIARSVAVCLLLLAGGFAAGMAVQHERAPEPDTTFADLDAVYDVIEGNYYYLPASDAERTEMDADMESGAIDGALMTLDDDYTRYLDVDESKTASEDLGGSYGGIGVDVRVEDQIAFVSAVIPDSPADRAGIENGDVIEQVNGVRVATDDPNDVLRMLRGEVGTEIHFTTIRPTTGEADTFHLTLEEIVVPSVTLEFIEGTSYAWLRISQFGDTTVADLDTAISTIRESGATGVILDLRGNGGGWVVAARQTLGRFLDPSVGPAMYEDTSANDDDMEALPIETAEGIVPLDLPMVVLVDGSTASAAEIVAGALKDYGRARIVGQATFGKGSVQRIFQFSDGATMRVTVAEWFTPSRSRIQGEGIRPDIVIDATAPGNDGDPDLQAAIDILNTQSASTPVAVLTPTSKVNKLHRQI